MKYSWLEQIFAAYNSGACGTFALFGNTTDIFPKNQTQEYTNIVGKLIEDCGPTMQVILQVDPSSGISVLKGSDILNTFLAKSKFTSGGTEELLEQVHEYLLYIANKGDGKYCPTIIFLTNAEYLVGEQNTPKNALLIKRWSEDPHILKERILTFIISPELRKLHELIVSNNRIEKIEVESPNEEAVEKFLHTQKIKFPTALARLKTKEAFNQAAKDMEKTSLHSLEKVLKLCNYEGKELDLDDLVCQKRKIVELESKHMLEFISGHAKLTDLAGEHNIAIRTRFVNDITLWNKGLIQLMPNGYLLVGPPGTGKTYFVECLAGSTTIPIVKVKNFRGQFQGETEGNLELIFRLLKTLPRVFVFIDEAEQFLGSRQQSASDGGVSGRVYAMFAQEIASKQNKGRICWIMATSHPHLLEPDLKRPGRIDIKIPLLPCEDEQAGAALLKELGLKAKLEFGKIINIPPLLTPGSADVLVTEVLRQKEATRKPVTTILNALLQEYQSPDLEKMCYLTQKAIVESSSTAFVPQALVKTLKKIEATLNIRS